MLNWLKRRKKDERPELEDRVATLERAFRALEHEFADLEERNASALGRISRLKRDVKAGKLEFDPSVLKGADLSEATAAPVPRPPQSDKWSSRAVHGVFPRRPL